MARMVKDEFDPPWIKTKHFSMSLTKYLMCVWLLLFYCTNSSVEEIVPNPLLLLFTSVVVVVVPKLLLLFTFVGEDLILKGTVHDRF